MMNIRAAVVAAAALLCLATPGWAQPSCPGSQLAVQLLGSGGPAINASRASTSYLVWLDGRARVMVDAGGGAFLRFGESSADLNDLWFLGISHLHPDHTSDLPALLWRSQTVRQQPLPVSGPAGDDAAPDVTTFLSRLFDQKNGAFQVMGPAVGGEVRATGGSVRLLPNVVDATRSQPSEVFAGSGMAITAKGIPHLVPTLAYRVTVAGKSIVFSSDQNGSDPTFADFAKDADLLVMHLQLGVGSGGPGHATPTVVGQVARAARAKRLLLGHIGQFDLDAAVAEVKQYYSGPVTVGADLLCTTVR